MATKKKADESDSVEEAKNPTWGSNSERGMLMAHAEQRLLLDATGDNVGLLRWQVGPTHDENGEPTRNGALLEEINVLLMARVQFLDSIVHDPVNADLIQMYRDINAKIADRQARRAAAGVLGTIQPISEV